MIFFFLDLRNETPKIEEEEKIFGNFLKQDENMTKTECFQMQECGVVCGDRRMVSL